MVVQERNPQATNHHIESKAHERLEDNKDKFVHLDILLSFIKSLPIIFSNYEAPVIDFKTYNDNDFVPYIVHHIWCDFFRGICHNIVHQCGAGSIIAILRVRGT